MLSTINWKTKVQPEYIGLILRVLFQKITVTKEQLYEINLGNFFLIRKDEFFNLRKKKYVLLNKIYKFFLLEDSGTGVSEMYLSYQWPNLWGDIGFVSLFVFKIFIYLFIYLFIYDFIGSSLLHTGFL